MATLIKQIVLYGGSVGCGICLLVSGGLLWKWRRNRKEKQAREAGDSKDLGMEMSSEQGGWCGGESNIRKERVNYQTNPALQSAES